jgi:hypothetical protein
VRPFGGDERLRGGRPPWRTTIRTRGFGLVDTAATTNHRSTGQRGDGQLGELADVRHAHRDRRDAPVT